MPRIRSTPSLIMWTWIMLCKSSSTGTRRRSARRYEVMIRLQCTIPVGQHRPTEAAALSRHTEFLGCWMWRGCLIFMNMVLNGHGAFGTVIFQRRMRELVHSGHGSILRRLRLSTISEIVRSESLLQAKRPRTPNPRISGWAATAPIAAQKNLIEIGRYRFFISSLKTIGMRGFPGNTEPQIWMRL